MTQVLTDKHPDKQKIQKWFDMGAKLGIRIQFLGHRTLISVGNSEQYDLEDFDNAGENERLVDTINLPNFTVEIWCDEEDPETPLFYACNPDDDRAYAYLGDSYWTEDGYSVKENKPSYALLVERAFSLWMMAYHCKEAA